MKVHDGNDRFFSTLGVICLVNDSSNLDLSQVNSFNALDWEFIENETDFSELCQPVPQLPDTVEGLKGACDVPWCQKVFYALYLHYSSEVSYDLGGERALDSLWFTLINACLSETSFCVVAGESNSSSIKKLINSGRDNIGIKLGNGPKYDGRIVPTKSDLDRGSKLVEAGFVEIGRADIDIVDAKFIKDSQKMVKGMYLSLIHAGGFLRVSLLISGFGFYLIIMSRLPSGVCAVQLRKLVSFPKVYCRERVEIVLAEMGFFVALVKCWKTNPFGQSES